MKFDVIYTEGRKIKYTEIDAKNIINAFSVFSKKYGSINRIISIKEEGLGKRKEL